MCSSGADRSSTDRFSQVGSPAPTVSNCAFVFILVFCQVVKTFTAHFVLYFVFLGTVSDSKGGFPLSRKFYVRADVNLAGFTYVNKIKKRCVKRVRKRKS